MRRELRVDVYELVVVPRAKLEVRQESAPWDGRTLGRWFGLDGSRAPAAAGGPGRDET